MTTIKIDWEGVEAMLQSGAVAKAVSQAAASVASNASHTTRHGEDIPVKTTDFITSNMKLNRAASAVSLAHPAGPYIQARHGTLTKAASAAGLEVKPRKAKRK